MIRNIEEFELEKKVKIYRECIDTILSNNYVRGNDVMIEGINISFKDLLDICFYIISIYGNNYEQKMFYKMYGFSNYVLDDEIIYNIRKDRLKYIYEYREKYYGKNKMLKSLVSSLNISMSDIGRLSKEYATSYLKYNVKDYDWNTLCKSRENINAKMSFSMLFDMLLLLDDKDDIVYLINYSCVQRCCFREEYIDSYIRLSHGDKTSIEQQKIKDKLFDKINIYKDYLKEQHNIYLDEKYMKSLEKAREFLNNYINSQKSYKYQIEYCRKLGVRHDMLKSELYILSKSGLASDKELYDLCIEKINNDNEIGSSDVNAVAFVIADYIINGVNSDGRIRNFDLIDYYTLTNVNYNEICKSLEKKLERKDYVKIKRFFAANDKLCKFLMNSKKAVDLDIEFNCKKDKDGFPIAGTGRKLTEEERIEILNLFDRYNIPLYLFKVAIDRIKNDVKINDIIIKNKKKVRIHE